MTIHVGVHPYSGELSYYDDIKKLTIHEKITEVRLDEPDQIISMFEEIKSKISSSNLGNLCICLFRQNGYESRKSFIKEGQKIGFINVEIINFETACYILALSQIPYTPKEGDIIWMLRFVKFYVWEIKDQKAKFFGSWNIHCLEDVEKAVKELKLKNKDPKIIFHDSELYEQAYGKIEGCKFFEIQNQVFGISKAAVIKARIKSGDCEMTFFDAENFLSRNVTLTIWKEIVSFKYGQNLPVIFSEILKLEEDEDYLEIDGHNKEKEIIELPEERNLKLSFEIDQNEIYSLKIDPLEN